MDHGEKIIHSAKKDIAVNGMTIQIKRWEEEIEKGLSEQEFETEVRIGLKNIEKEVRELFRLKNEEN